jgi:hypothetical protein
LRKPPEKKNKLYGSNNTGNLNNAIEENGQAEFVFVNDFWGSSKKMTGEEDCSAIQDSGGQEPQRNSDENK